MGRKSLAEVEARRNDVYEMLMEGKSKSFIVSYCASNWGIKLSAVEKDIYAVREQINTQFQQEKHEIIATHVARYENLYRFYMDAGSIEDPNIHYNPETAAKMLEKKEKLLRLHNPDVVVEQTYIDKQQNNYSGWTLEELKEGIKILD
jgi:hypothetical protein